MENDKNIKYTVKIEKMDSNYATDNTIETFESGEFDDKKAANKFKKEMIKKHELIKHAGHVVNYSTRKELFTNY